MRFLAGIHRKRGCGIEGARLCRCAQHPLQRGGPRSGETTFRPYRKGIRPSGHPGQQRGPSGDRQAVRRNGPRLRDGGAGGQCPWRISGYAAGGEPLFPEAERTWHGSVPFLEHSAARDPQPDRVLCQQGSDQFDGPVDCAGPGAARDPGQRLCAGVYLHGPVGSSAGGNQSQTPPELSAEERSIGTGYCQRGGISGEFGQRQHDRRDHHLRCRLLLSAHAGGCGSVNPESCRAIIFGEVDFDLDEIKMRWIE